MADVLKRKMGVPQDKTHQILKQIAKEQSLSKNSAKKSGEKK